MNSQTHSVFSSLQYLIILIIFSQTLDGQKESQPMSRYGMCNNNFTCGNSISGFGYPFRGYKDPAICGYPGLALVCDSQTNVTNIDIMSTKYRVHEIDQSTRTMRISREDVMDANSPCPREKTNTTLDYSIFNYGPGYTNITFLYGCPDLKTTNYVSCGESVNGEGAYVLPGVYGPGKCEDSVVVPVPVTRRLGGNNNVINATGLGQVLREGFRISWNTGDESFCNECVGSKGHCGYDVLVNLTSCFCPDGPFISYVACPMAMASGASPPTHAEKNHSTTGREIGISVAGAVLACVVLGCLILFFRRRRLLASLSASEIETSSSSSKVFSSLPSRNMTNRTLPFYPSSISDLGIRSSYFGAQVFDCKELEKATNNFDSSRELGDGGFGTVYHGFLSDGRIVAVKRLYKHNFKRFEQFMNEVEILTQLSHQSLVKLYGCTSRRSRELLLVYEYIPNGTVAEHLHGERAMSGLLSWPVRLNIAVETANALTYLHKSDIIHRDVKTNNILLDNDFHVKVADFGLSRLFPSGATHISTAPSGTPGYVDPVYHQCYKLTEKSDVFSFGVVLMELISSLEAVDIERQHQDINLSNMAVNRIRKCMLHELVDPSLGFETDSNVRRMVTLVAEIAFGCLQQERDMRPSMEEVLEGLRGVQNEELIAHKVDIVEMTDDDVELLKGIIVSAASPDSVDVP